jgi:hypothetical protein
MYPRQEEASEGNHGSNNRRAYTHGRYLWRLAEFEFD